MIEQRRAGPPLVIEAGANEYGPDRDADPFADDLGDETLDAPPTPARVTVKPAARRKSPGAAKAR